MSDAKEIQEQLAELLQRPDEEHRARLIKAITREPIPGKMRLLGNQILSVGLSIDRWTVDGECAGLVLNNQDDREMVWQLMLSCKAGAGDLPLTAVVDDGEQRQEITFERPGAKRVDLPLVLPSTERLVVITTDKTWTPGTHDQRRLGVTVDVTPTGTLERLLQDPDPETRAKLTDEIARESFSGKLRLLGNQVVATGLSLDHWTEEGIPAGIVYTNYEDREVSPELLFSCHAPKSELPVALIIEDGKRQRRHVFKEGGTRQVALSPVGPHSKRLFIIATDKTWSPGPGDPRRLGVGVHISPEWTLRALQEKPDAYIRVKLAEVIANEPIAGKLNLLSDFFVAVGLTGDHWTQGEAPAALVITNVYDQELTPQLALSCNAGKGEVPLTVTIDDGQSTEQVAFTEAGLQRVTLAPVPQHSRRLFIISTDRTWSPGGGDKRKLGVSVDISPGGTMASLLERRNPKIWAKVAEAVCTRPMLGRKELGQGQVVAVGLTPDGWSQDGEPAGVSVRNPGEVDAAWELELGCHAGQEVMPVEVTVDDGEESQTLVFTRAGNQRVTLSAVPAGGCRLYIVQSDKTWSPGKGDERQLGVLIHDAAPSLLGTLGVLLRTPHDQTRGWVLQAIEQAPAVQVLDKPAAGVRAVALGLTGDRWTGREGPAGVVLSNGGKEDCYLELLLTCHAQPDSLPITATVDDGEERQECKFKEAGTRIVEIAPLPAGGKRLLIVSTDRTWSPGTRDDQRWLGVQLSFKA